MNDVILAIYLLSVYPFAHPSASPSGFTNEHILDALYVQRVFVGYIFFVRYTLVGIGFEANKLLFLMCQKISSSPNTLLDILIGCLPVFEPSCIFH